MKQGAADVALAFLQAGLLLGTLLACLSSSELSATGGDVEVASSPPVDHGYAPGSCKSLGYIIGHGGGALGGWVSNDKLVEYAMNDLRNKAAERGANYVEHDSPQMGVTGGESGTATTTATVSGTAYVCDSTGRKPVAAAPSGEAKPKAEPKVPEGAAGFKLGAALTEAQGLCTAAGFGWGRDGAQARCSGTPSSVGTPASVTLELCDERVCGIDVFATGTSSDLLKLYDDFHDRLLEKYGVPRRPREALSGGCRQALDECLASKAPAGAFWYWPDGHSVEIALASERGTSLIRVRYRTNAEVPKEAPGPAL